MDRALDVTARVGRPQEAPLTNSYATDPRTGSGRLRGTLVVGGLTLVAAVALVGAFVVVGLLSGVAFATFSRDPAEAAAVVYYTGYLALAVMLVWQTAAAVALLGGLVLRRAGHRQASTMLLVGGALTELMVIDDVFMLHENIYPRIGMPEAGTYILYGVLTVAFAWSFRRQLGADLLLLAGAAAFWVGAAIFELRQEAFGIFNHIGEDGLRAVGAILWAAFMIRVVLTELLAALRPADTTPLHVPEQRRADAARAPATEGRSAATRP